MDNPTKSKIKEICRIAASYKKATNKNHQYTALKLLLDKVSLTPDQYEKAIKKICISLKY